MSPTRRESELAEKERIMVVDDEPSIRKYLQTLLEVDGYAVETLSSGVEAIERVDGGETPDYIILDILMPELNGLETLKRLLAGKPPAQHHHAFVHKRGRHGGGSHPPRRAGLHHETL